MKHPLQVTFRNLPRSQALERAIRDRAYRLDTRFGELTSCRVVVGWPHRRHEKGNQYRVCVDIAVPGCELVADSARGDDPSNEDVYVAVRNAFDAAHRELAKYNTRRRRRRHSSVQRI